ncbi:MAG: hypothetical protein RXR41_03495, partial [Candidatus Marsarchaeota archaeon]
PTTASRKRCRCFINSPIYFFIVEGLHRSEVLLRSPSPSTYRGSMRADAARWPLTRPGTPGNPNSAKPRDTCFTSERANARGERRSARSVKEFRVCGL